MKKLIALFTMVAFILIFSFVILSGNLMAQDRKKGEFCLGGNIFLWDGDTDLFGMISLGGNYKVVGYELNVIVINGDALIAGNLRLGLFDSQKLIPYATGGVWTTEEGIGFNVGGGLILRLTEKFGIRAEYRRWFFGEKEGDSNSILGGICVFF